MLFNASVVLAGLKFPSGGSAKLLSLCEQGKIIGIISEIIAAEVLRNCRKIGFDQEVTLRKLQILKILPPPSEVIVEIFDEKVVDPGDAHVLASAKEHKVAFLVSLDKHHILILRSRIKDFQIVSPAELIEITQQFTES